MHRSFSKTILDLKSTTSTNDYAMNLIAKSDPIHGMVIKTDEQTQGRGQYGRKWMSAPGENLIMSLILKHRELSISNQFYISITTALALADVLKKYGLQAFIKWPNDIYIGNKKICGILIQNIIQGKNISSSVVGIGLNVLQSTFDPDLPNPTSLSLESNDFIKMDLVFELLLERLEFYYQKLERLEYNALLTTYNAQLYKRNETSHFRKKGDSDILIGTIRGVNSNGQLELEIADGDLESFHFHEISMVK